MQSATIATLQPTDPAGFAALADAWRDVESRAQPGHYASTHQWLSAWLTAFPARALVHVEVADDSGRLAVGLLERLPLGRLRFAGAPVSPRGCLLVAAGSEVAAWSAFAHALADRRGRWTALQCVGAPDTARVLARAVVTATPEYVLELPGDYEAYLGDRTKAARKSLKQKLRRLNGAGVTAEVPAERHPEALRRFVELHALRARDRGESHPHIDVRLSHLLGGLAAHGTGISLRIFELHADEKTVATTIRLDYGETAFFYNGGFDPAYRRLSPGISMELASIRDAIERGLRRFDLGPGTYRYKSDLGGVRAERFRVIVGAPGLPAATVPLARTILRRARRSR